MNQTLASLMLKQQWAEVESYIDSSISTFHRKRKGALTELLRSESVPVQLVEKFLVKGANPNEEYEGSDGVLTNPLRNAVLNNCHIKILKLLIDYGAKMRELFFKTPLSKNCQELLETNLDLVDNDGNSPAHAIVENFYETDRIFLSKLLKNLKNKGLDTNQKNNEGNTPLHLLRGTQSAFIFDLETNNLDERNNDHSTPLHLFVQSQYVFLTQHIISLGANVTLRDGRNRTVLELSLQNPELFFAKRFLIAGVDPNELTSTGQLPLEYALRKKMPFSVFADLLSFGAKLDFKIDGLEPIRYAINNELSATIVAILCEYTLSKIGIDFEFSKEVLIYLLQRCNQLGNNTIEEKAFRSLLENSNFDLDNSSLSENSSPTLEEPPLFVAIRRHRLDIIKLLLEHKANPNLYHNEGYTPILASILHMSSSTIEVIKLLVKHGAVFDRTNSEGETPVLLWIRRHPSNIKVLNLLPFVESFRIGDQGRKIISFVSSLEEKKKLRWVEHLVTVGYFVSKNLCEGYRRGVFHARSGRTIHQQLEINYCVENMLSFCSVLSVPRIGRNSFLRFLSSDLLRKLQDYFL